MTEQLQPDDLSAVFLGAFRNEYDQGSAKTWRHNYVEFVRAVRDASPDQWMQPAFQEALWDRNPISNIGPGRAVTVVGAYGDRELAEILLRGRDKHREGTPADRGKAIQALY